MARPIYDPSVTLRKRIIKTLARQLRAALDGNPRPAAEVLDEIDALIVDDLDARLQDAIQEIRLNDE
jgi:hypothetical protein